VILAMGHLSPVAPLPGLDALGAAYINDPWSGAVEHIGTDERVLILGSGLTMLDVVVDLARRGHRGPITALSRRGLL
ncbi:FAD-dependent oxidoreductase, partial [Salmonella enterica subsp. enterica serovar Typhimurium]|nr:FAD-dependent oxidoreductase [Salmonella enterica subsp. enterica serovar Typhimurium]